MCRSMHADDDEPLLTRSRAAEHVLHAIAQARSELITAELLALLGHETSLQEADEAALPSWAFGGHEFVKSGSAAVMGAAAVVTAPLEVPT